MVFRNVFIAIDTRYELIVGERILSHSSYLSATRSTASSSNSSSASTSPWDYYSAF